MSLAVHLTTLKLMPVNRIQCCFRHVFSFCKLCFDRNLCKRYDICGTVFVLDRGRNKQHQTLIRLRFFIRKHLLYSFTNTNVHSKKYIKFNIMSYECYDSSNTVTDMILMLERFTFNFPSTYTKCHSSNEY